MVPNPASFDSLRLTAADPAPAVRAPDPWALWLFDRYMERLFSRQLAGSWWAAESAPDRWDPGLPLLFVSNHTNWWDGFLAYVLTRRLGRTFHILMQAEHLARYGFFRRIGVLPLRRSLAMAAHHDLLASRGALDPANGMWIFPQGARRPALEPFAEVESGAALLALGAGRPVLICPVAFRYIFRGESHPEAVALLGTPWRVEPGESGRAARRTLTAEIELRVAALIGRLDDRLGRESMDEFRQLLPGRPAINKRFDRWRHRLGLLRGPFEERNG